MRLFSCAFKLLSELSKLLYSYFLLTLNVEYSELKPLFTIFDTGISAHIKKEPSIFPRLPITLHSDSGKTACHGLAPVSIYFGSAICSFVLLFCRSLAHRNLPEFHHISFLDFFDDKNAVFRPVGLIPPVLPITCPCSFLLN